MTTRSPLNRRNLLFALTAAATVVILLPQVASAQRKLKPPPDDQIQKVSEAMPEKPTAKPAKARKILVFCRCEGFFHGSIPLCNEALTIMGKKTGAFETVVSDDMSVFTAENLEQFDVVLFNNTTRLSFKDPKQRQALMDFIKGGKGIVGIHAATDNFYDWPEAAEMMGGLFHGHPWGGGGTWAMKIDEPEHTINKGFGGKGFWIKDEIYRMRDPYTRENLRVLVSLDMTKEVNQKGSREDNDNAVSWIREYGKGRLFYCSLGHNNHIFWTPAVLQHYLDGIQYALGDLKADATPSAKLGEKPEPALAPEKQ